MLQTRPVESPEVTAVVESELTRGEELLWSGQPRPGLVFRSTDIFMIPFSLLWGGFAIFWVVIVTAGSGWFGLLGIPFAAIGLFMIFGRFIWDAAMRSRTFYGVTDRRLITIRTRWRRAVSTIPIGQLGAIEMREHRSGRATIIFGPIAMSWLGVQPGLNFSSRPQAQRSNFDHIEDGRRVYELIRDAAI